MLPRTFLSDHDLILCAYLNRTMMTTNVHPLYLSPVVCWLNRTCVQVQRVKCVCLNGLKVVSTVILFTTIFLHMVRLWNLPTLGLLGSIWSLMVCAALIGGFSLTILSSDKRSSPCDTSVAIDSMAGVSVCQKLVFFSFLLATYIYTWLYYKACSDIELVGSQIDCSGKRLLSTFPIVQWTTFAFSWINTIGFIRLVTVQ